MRVRQAGVERQPVATSERRGCDRRPLCPWRLGDPRRSPLRSDEVTLGDKLCLRLEHHTARLARPVKVEVVLDESLDVIEMRNR